MARKMLSVIVVGLMGIGLTAVQTRAGDQTLKKELALANTLTGSDPTAAELQVLIDNKDNAKKLIGLALPLAKKKTLRYNAAFVLGLAAADMKDMKSAETFLRVCMDQAAKLQSAEKLYQSYSTLIKLYYGYKQYADAARICKELFDLNTDDGKPRVVIATSIDRSGDVDFSEPEDGFRTAERVKPTVLEYYIKATAKQGKFDEALKMVDSLRKRKGDWRDEHLKAWVLREAGKLKEAASMYENVIRQVGKDRRLESDEKEEYVEQLRYEASNIYIDLKNIDRATEHLEYLLEKRPDDAMFYNDLGYIWADNDVKLAEAEKLIRKALELDREARKKLPKFDAKTDHDNGAYLDSLGWVLFKQKNYVEAKKWLLKAVEDKASQHIEIFDHLGDVYMALGERAAAVGAWEKGLGFVTDTRRDQERKALVEKKLEEAKQKK